MGEFLLWCLAAFVSLWLLGWTLNRLLPRIARAVNAALDKTSGYLPRAMLPIEHTLLSLLLAGLTVVIALFPAGVPWGFVVLPATEATLQPGVFLGAAAALLALLLFAANQVRNFEKDAGSGNVYLGQNVETFLARRSRVVRMLGLPVFHLAVSTLFIVPLVWSLLPTNLQISDLGSELLPQEWSPQLVAIAAWCASFGVVSGVLLLNVLNTLRNSTLGFSAPNGIELRIEIELGDLADQAYAQFFRGKHDLSDEMYRWTAGRVTKASELPQAQQVLYLNTVIGSLSYRLHQERTIEKCLKIIEKPERSFATNHVGEWLASWLLGRRFRRAENILNNYAALAKQRTRAMLRSLHVSDLTDEVRAWLIKQCITDATCYNRHVAQLLDLGLLRREKRNPTPRDHFLKEVRNTVLVPVHRIPDLDGYSPLSFPSDTSPVVEAFSGFTFKALAAALFPRGSNQGSKISGDLLREMLSAADGITHRATRDYVLRELVDAVIHCVILTRADAETLPVNVLGSRQRQRRREEPSYLEPSGRKSRRLIIEEQAMVAMTTNTDIQPAARTALVELLTEWRPPTALLFLLFHGVRARRSMTARDIAPFYTAWRDHPAVAPLYPENTLTKALRFFCGSNVDHFVSAEGVTWLFQALDRHLTLELCVAFLKMPFTDFHLVQFVQWHTIASDRPYSYDSDDVELEPEICRQLAWAKPELQQFADDWYEVDQRSASSLHALLMRFPST